MMSLKTAACALAVTLLAGTASFVVPAVAQNSPMPSSHSRTLFPRAVAEYDAGLRRGRAASARNAYLRGFRDGTSSEVYSSRAYILNPAAGYAVRVPGYSSYDRDADYANGIGRYPFYDSRPVSYRGIDGYVSDRYDSGSATVVGLMDVVTEPLSTTSYLVTRAAQFTYCAARYKSYDPASGTFLGHHGYRHYCQ